MVDPDDIVLGLNEIEIDTEGRPIIASPIVAEAIRNAKAQQVKGDLQSVRVNIMSW